MATCRVTPYVRTKDGGMAKSALHLGLQAYIHDKDIVNNLWETARDGAKDKDGNDLPKDSNGEVSADALLGLTDAGKLVSDMDLAAGLNAMRGEAAGDASVKTWRDKTREAVRFNASSPLNKRVVASVKDDNGRAALSFEPSSEEAVAKADAMRRGLELHDRLESWLTERGIAIGVLTETEEGAGVSGVTDFKSAARTASGLREIIRVAKGERGWEAVTEEAAHVAVMALLGKDQGVDRAMATLRSHPELVRETLGGQYDEYSRRYAGDQEKLAHEAAGHLLRDQFNDTFDKAKAPQASRFTSLWGRLKEAVLRLFREFTEDGLSRMMEEARISLGKTARKILDDECYKELEFSAEASGIDRLFAISKENNTKLKDMVERMIKDNRSRLRRIPASFRKRWDGRKSRFFYLSRMDRQMKANFNSGLYLNSMLIYLRNASNDLYYQLNTFADRLGRAKAENKPYIINNIDEMVSIYSQVLEDSMAMMEELKAKDGDDAVVQQTIQPLQAIIDGYDNEKGEHVPGMAALLKGCSAKIRMYKMPTFLAFVSKFLPQDRIIVPNGGRAYGKDGGEEVTLEEQMRVSPEVGRIDKWFLPAALSNSLPVQVFQRVLNKTQLEIRDDTLNYAKRLKELALNLERAGYENQDWMFERDKKGGLTGNYITRESKEFKALSEAQKKYYNEVLAIKNELDMMLPSDLTDLLSAPKIRKDFLEQIARSDKVSWKTIKDFMSETWSVKSDDEYTLDRDRLILDYNNHQLRVVPVRFLRFAEGEDSQNMSLDVTSTMTRYAQMCCNYSKMTRVMPALELGRTILGEGYSSHDKPVKGEDGKTVTEGVVGESRSRNLDDNTMSRINDIMESGYGFKAENVTVTMAGKTVSLTAIGQKLMALTAANQYMLSVCAAVQNEITSQLQFLGESTGRKYYDKNDLTWAQWTFSENLPHMLADSFNRVPDSKISLFNERFNVLMKNETEKFNRRGWKRWVGSKSLYVLTTMGEYHANTAIALAVAHRYKLKHKDGGELNLWDAMEVVDMAEKKLREAKRLRDGGDPVAAEAIEDDVKRHPEWKGSANKYLVLRDGVMKTDGTEFTADDIHDVTRRIMHVSHVLNGVYNPEDAAKWQRYIGGQMIGMYRKWIAPAWYRRLNGLNYSLDDKEWSEGFYRTFGRILYTRARALFDKTLAAQIKGKELTPMERGNLRRAVFEVGMWSVAIVLKALLGSYKDKKRSYAWNTMYYYVVRTSSELNSMNPVGMPTETLRIFQSISATLSTVNNIMGLVGAMFNPTTWGWFSEDAIVKSGKYKGLSKFERALVKSPIFPGSHQYFAFMYPEDSVKFYE